MDKITPNFHRGLNVGRSTPNDRTLKSYWEAEQSSGFDFVTVEDFAFRAGFNKAMGRISDAGTCLRNARFLLK